VIAALALTVSLTGCKREGEDKGAAQANEAATQVKEAVTQADEPATPIKEAAAQVEEPSALTVPSEQQAPKGVKEAEPQASVLTNKTVGFMLDGMEAQFLGQEEEKSPSSRWTVADPVSPAPRFSFELLDPQALGDLKTISLKFYPKWKGEYLPTAGPVIVSADPENADSQFMPKTTYDLSTLGESFKILDARSAETARFMLRPGFEYKMEVVFEGEKVHTAEIFLTTTK
jgi:hypothetical protein